ncbi:replicative DNA helicase [bacterium]|nr:replicative DNA helicase [bacterium]
MTDDTLSEIGPPFSDEAELSVLGAIMLRPDTIDQIRDRLLPEHFYRDAHRHVYATMCALHDERTAIDPVMLHESLTRQGLLESIGGTPFIARLADVTPTSANIAHYARIVVDKALLRRLINESRTTLAKAHAAAEPAPKIIDDALSRILGVSFEQDKGSVLEIREVMKDVLAEMKALAKSGKTMSGIPSGFYGLDEMTNGFQRGDLIILAARPSMGKTALALNIARHAASNAGGDAHTIFFSMEMPRQSIGMRLVCTDAGLPLASFRAPKLVEENFSQLARAAAELYDLPLFVDDSAALSVLDIRTRARRLKAQRGRLDLIILDYVQLVRPGESLKVREQEIARISRELKQIAKELDVPVVALAQLNRMLESRGNKRPMLSDLRESGALEQDADLILFLYRAWVYKQRAEGMSDERRARDDMPEEDMRAGPNDAELIVGKHRNGPTGTVSLRFAPEFARFENPAHAYQEEYDEY